MTNDANEPSPSASGRHPTGSFDINDANFSLEHYNAENYDWMGVLESLESEQHHHEGENGVVSGESSFEAFGAATASGDTENGANNATHQMEEVVMDGGSQKVAADDSAGHCASVGNNDHKIGTNTKQAVSPVLGNQSTENVFETASELAVTNYLPSASNSESNNEPPASLTGKSTTESSIAGDTRPVLNRLPSSVQSQSSKEEDDKSSRVERKRNREKQRRLDTNSQFTALAAIVREIETTDFVEEAQYNMSNKAAAKSNALKPNEDSEKANKKLKSDDSFADPLSSSTGTPFSTSGAFNSSNRVDLIARTSAILTQLRIIRQKRTEEVRQCRRQNCEMRKEMEEMRRMIAHYKTMGMGMQKPHDKVSDVRYIVILLLLRSSFLILHHILQLKIMMMVPMMVPQHAVSSINAGFPSAHMYGNQHHHFAPPSPWMQQQQMQAAASASATPHPTMQAPASSTAPVEQPPQQNPSKMPTMELAPQHLHPATSTATTAPVPGHPPMPHAFSHFAPQPQGFASYPPYPMMQPQPYPVPGFPGYAAAMPPPQLNGDSMHMSTDPIHPGSVQGYPHAAPVGMHPPMQPSVNQQTTLQQNSTNLSTSPSSGSQQQQQPEKPTAPQGGGGNLAHCA